MSECMKNKLEVASVVHVSNYPHEQGAILSEEGSGGK